jgi:hypothetical protein
VQAKEVIEKLKSDVKDANGMTLMDAHKRMGPCYDFGLPDTAAVAVCDHACLPPTFKCAVSAESKADSMALSVQLKAITDKWDGQAAQPLADDQMSILAELMAYIKFLPSQAMKGDFHLDAKFNTTNTKNKYTRSIVSFGGPLGHMQASLPFKPQN